MDFKEKFEIAVLCPICHEEHSVYVEKADYYRWLRGAHVQNAFSYLNASEREILISGTCPECWDNLFKEVV